MPLDADWERIINNYEMQKGGAATPEELEATRLKEEAARRKEELEATRQKIAAEQNHQTERIRNLITAAAPNAPNYYAVLDVKKGADNSEIKKNYRKLALLLHPDKGGDTVVFQFINQAFETLGNEDARNEYDATQPEGEKSPRAAAPNAESPRAAAPNAAAPNAAAPNAESPRAAAPNAAAPNAAAPNAAALGAANPGVTNPGVTNPGVTNPGVTNPGAVALGPATLGLQRDGKQKRRLSRNKRRLGRLSRRKRGQQRQLQDGHRRGVRWANSTGKPLSETREYEKLDEPKSDLGQQKHVTKTLDSTKPAPKSVKDAFKFRGTVPDIVKILGESVRLNELNFVPVTDSGIVSFKDKYLHADSTEDEISNAKIVFGSVFHPKSAFNIGDPKPPCGVGEYPILQKGLQRRLHLLRNEIIRLYKTTDDSVMTRTAVEHAQKLITVINTLHKNMEQNPGDCVNYDPNNAYLSTGLTGVDDHSIKSLYATFSYLVLQHLRQNNPISKEFKQERVQIDATKFIQQMTQNQADIKKVMDYANALKKEDSADALPTEIAIILGMDVGTLINESNMKMIKELTGAFQITGDSVDEIIDSLKEKLANLSVDKKKCEADLQGSEAKIALLEAELQQCLQKSNVNTQEESDLLLEIKDLQSKIAEKEQKLQEEIDNRPAPSDLVEKKLLENKLVDAQKELVITQAQMKGLKADKMLLITGIEREKEKSRVASASPQPDSASVERENELANREKQLAIRERELVNNEQQLRAIASSMASSDAGSDAGSVAGSDVGSVAGSDAGSVAGSDVGSVAGSDVGSVAGSDTGSVAGSDTGSVAGSDTGSVAGSDVGSVAGSDVGSVADPVAEAEKRAMAELQEESKPAQQETVPPREYKNAAVGMNHEIPSAPVETSQPKPPTQRVVVPVLKSEDQSKVWRFLKNVIVTMRDYPERIPKFLTGSSRKAEYLKILNYKERPGGTASEWPNYQSILKNINYAGIDSMKDADYVTKTLQEGYQQVKPDRSGSHNPKALGRFVKLILTLMRMSYVFIGSQDASSDYIEAILQHFNSIKEKGYNRSIISVLFKDKASDLRHKLRGDDFFEFIRKGGATDEIKVLFQRLYEKIKVIRKAYKKSVKNLLSSLKEKGYISKLVRPPSIPRAYSKDELEMTLDAILDDLETGQLKKSIENLPPLSEILHEFEGITSKETTNLHTVLMNMKDNTSRLSSLHKSLKPISTALKSRPKNPILADLLKQFS